MTDVDKTTPFVVICREESKIVAKLGASGEGSAYACVLSKAARAAAFLFATYNSSSIAALRANLNGWLSGSTSAMCGSAAVAAVRVAYIPNARNHAG